MKMNRNKLTIMAIAIVTLFVLWNLKPRDFEGKRQVAFVEFDNYLDMNNMAKGFFSGPFINLQDRRFTEFYWNLETKDGDTGTVSVLVPAFPLQEVIVTYTGDSTAWNKAFNSEPNN